MFERLLIVCSILDIVAPRSERSKSILTKAPSTAVNILTEFLTLSTSSCEIELSTAPDGFPENNPKLTWCDYGCISCIEVKDKKIQPIYFGK